MKGKVDLITGGAVFLGSLFYMINANSIKVFSGEGATSINSKTIPIIWGSCLMLLSILMISRYFINVYRNRAKNKESQNSDIVIEERFESQKTETVTEKKENYRIKFAVPLTFLLLIAYVALMKEAGFLITTSAYLFLQIVVLSPRGKIRWYSSASLSIVASIVIYEVFVRLLNVPLPAGLLTF